MASTQGAIVAGEPATDPAVVMVSARSGTFCTGTLIAARVVLTAKHCVQPPDAEAPVAPEELRVSVGDDSTAVTSTHDVIEVLAPPGVYRPGGTTGIGEGIEGDDVALLVLSAPAPPAPVGVRTTAPTDLGGAAVRAVGFGTTPAGDLGHKNGVDVTITEVRDRTLVTGPATCSGDSGGPLFDAAGQVVGVSSFQLGSCGTGTSHFNRLDVHADLIASALAAGGACTPDGAEACDARDNDCNGMVDEGCVALGGSCTAAGECARGGACIETPTGLVCSIPCDPLRPSLGCGPGFYCALADLCNGFCLAGGPGTGANGAACLSDGDCASSLCVDPGDGARRCAAPCASDTGACAAGDLCAAEVLTCGGCVSSGWGGMRGLGEPCAEDAECYSLHCGDDFGARYCSRFCDDDDVCGEGFHCREGQCVRGARGAAGEGCRDDGDCRDGLGCVAVGDASVCASGCVGDTCEEGFTCRESDDGLVCLPELGLLGAACTSAADCVSGLCADTTDGQVCTQRCSVVTPCPPAFQCVRPDDGSESVCVRLPTAPPPDEGGGCRAARGPSPTLPCVLLCAGALVAWIRRHSRAKKPRTFGTGQKLRLSSLSKKPVS